MNNYTILIDFIDGQGYIDYSAYLINELELTEKLHNKYKATTNSVEITFKKHLPLINRFLASNDKAYAKMQKDGVDLFTGIIRTDGSFTVHEDIREFNVEILDFSALLKKKIKEGCIYKDWKLCDPNDKANSLIHDILYKSGFTDSYINTLPTLNKIIPLFELEEKKEYFKLLDDLLFEYGYTFIFDNSGLFNLVDLAPNTVNIDYTFNNGNMLHGFEVTKEDEENVTAKVVWYELASKDDVLLYRGVSDPEEPISVPYGLYYPYDGKVKDRYQRYKPVIPEMEDTPTVKYTSNHYLDYVVEDPLIVIDTQSYDIKQAQIIFHNTSVNTNYNLEWFDIRGDLVYKGDEHTISVYGWEGEEFYEEYKADYINTEEDATKLVNILHDRYQFARMQYSFQSMDEISIGAIVSIVDTVSGINTTARVYQKSYSTKEPIISYVAEGLTAYAEQQITDIVYSGSVSTPINYDVPLPYFSITRPTQPITIDRGIKPQIIDADYICYFNYDDSNKLYKKNYKRLTEGKKLLDTTITDFGVFNDDVIMYSDADGNIERLTISTTATMSLTSATGHKPKKWDDTYFTFINNDDSDTIWKSSVNDGTNGSQFINLTVADYVKIDDDTIAFTTSEVSPIYKYVISTATTTAITSSHGTDLQFMNGYLYYVNTTDYSIYKTSLDDALDGDAIYSDILSYVFDSDGNLVFTENSLDQYLKLRLINNTEPLTSIDIIAPAADVTFYGDIEGGVDYIANYTDEAFGITNIGDTISGVGIQENTTVTNVDENKIYLSKTATATLYQTRLYLNSNKVLIGTESLMPGAITEVKITDNAISAPKIKANAITTDKLDANAIFTLNLRSQNYVEGVSGFDLNKNGNAELNNVVARGHIEAESGSFSGSLNAASGTFVGSLYAASGNFKGYIDSAALKTEQGNPTIETYSLSWTSQFPSTTVALGLYYWLSSFGDLGTVFFTDGNTTINGAVVHSMSTHTDPVVKAVICYRSDGTIIRPVDNFTNVDWTFNGGGDYSVMPNSNGSATFGIKIGGDIIKLIDLPSSPSGLVPYQLYNDNGTIKIVT